MAIISAITFGLNPYSNGIWIERRIILNVAIMANCLNPYSNGIWIEQPEVSFAYLMGGLNPYSNGIWIEQKNMIVCAIALVRLNPYSNGIWIEPYCLRGYHVTSYES